MFRFNQKKANREVDEIKRLLSITKGRKTSSSSISSSFLREDVDMIGNPNQPINGSTANPVDMATPDETAKSDDIKKIEDAIETAKIDKIDSDTVEGTASKEKISFIFDREESNPKIEIDKNIELTDDINKIIDQINAYFDIWKKETP
jgi:hypothetical protein